MISNVAPDNIDGCINEQTGQKKKHNCCMSISFWTKVCTSIYFSFSTYKLKINTQKEFKITHCVQIVFDLMVDDYMAALAKVHSQCRNWSI